MSLGAPSGGETAGDVVRIVAGGGGGLTVGVVVDLLLNKVIELSTEADIAVGGGFTLAGMAVALCVGRRESGAE